MKKLTILTLVLLIFITGNALAFEDFTGEDWNKLNTSEKEIFLRGLQEGMNFINFVWISDYSKVTNYDEVYRYMKNNDKRINLGNERKILLNDYFEENPNVSYLELAGKGYVSNSVNDNPNVSEIKFDDKNEVVVKGYETEIYSEFESDPYYPHSKLFIHFENKTIKRVTGIKYNLKIYDNFGDLIVNMNQKSSIVIEPKNENYVYFTFSEFMDTQIYNLIANDTLEVSVSINDVVFN